jgi:Family of unknown function (DUF6343)
LRFALALFGLVTCAAAAVGLAVVGAPAVWVVVAAVGAVIAIIDLLVIARRKRSGEPG